MEISDETKRRLAQALIARVMEQSDPNIPLQQRDAMEMSRRAMASGDYAPMMNNGQVAGYTYRPWWPQRMGGDGQ